MHDYQFRVAGEETISTPVGDIDSIKLERVRKSPDVHTYIWLAKKWSFVILKILHQEKGEPDYVLNLTEGTVGNKSIE